MPRFHELFRRCSFYIQVLRSGTQGCFLVRSVNRNIDFQRCRHCINERVPRNMDESVHTAINQHFFNVFRWPVRNGVFCYGVINPTSNIQDLGYGQPYLMFPCGKFDFVCDNDIFDLYGHYVEFSLINVYSHPS